MSERNISGEAPAGELPSGAAVGDDSDFDTNWQKFLEHSFGDEDEEASSEETQESTPAATGDTIQGGEGNDSISTAEASAPGPDSAAAPASDTVPGGGGSDAIGENVDQKLLARMLGFSEEPKPTGESAAPGKPGASSEPSGSGDDELFMPFTPDFKLQPEMVSALFEAEDMGTRERALVGLLAAFGNTILVTAEKRWQEHHYPRIVSAATGSFQTEQVGKAINDDFYGAFPELSEYKPAVKRAFQIVGETVGADKPYSPELREQIGNLARQALAQAGVKLPPRKGGAPAAPAKPATPAKAKPASTPFEAGGSRPDTGSSDLNSPDNMLKQLSEFG